MHPSRYFQIASLLVAAVLMPFAASGQAAAPPQPTAPPAQAAAQAASPSSICGNAKAAKTCLNQPYEGDASITGKVDPAALTKDGKPVTITISGTIHGASAVALSPVTPDKNGNFAISVNALSQYDTVTLTFSGATPAIESIGPVVVMAAPPSKSGIFTLGLAGINVTAASSASPKQQYFVTFNLVAPLRWAGPVCGPEQSGDPASRRCLVWFNPRIGSLPAVTSTALSSPASLTSGITSQDVGQITQSFEFQTGFEYGLLRPADTSFWGHGDGWAKSGISFIFGGGIRTPFNPLTQPPEFTLNSNLAQQFAQNPALETTYPVLAAALCNFGLSGSICANAPAAGATTVAFLFPNRSRFYRDFFGGFRFKFLYYTGRCSGKSPGSSCQLSDIFPGTLDVKLGEDESVTHGKMIPFVVTVSGTFALPGTHGILRVFGSTYLHAAGNVDATPLVLVPAANLPLDSTSLVVQPINPSDQDSYRLGIGVDIIPLITKWMNKPGSSASNTP